MRILLALAAIFVPLSSAAAQSNAPASVNGYTWPLLTAADPVPVLAADPAGTKAPPSLVVAGPFPPLSVPLDEPESGRSWSITGAVVGVVVGAAVGGALGCLANRDSYGVFCGGQSDTKVVIGAVLGAGVGGWIGAVLPGRLR